MGLHGGLETSNESAGFLKWVCMEGLRLLKSLQVSRN